MFLTKTIRGIECKFYRFVIFFVLFSMTSCGGEPSSQGVHPPYGGDIFEKSYKNDVLEEKISIFLKKKIKYIEKNDKILFSFKPIEGSKFVSIYYMGKQICGSGGCKLAIVSYVDGNIEEIGLVNRVSLPVKILPFKRNGYPVFSVVSSALDGSHVRAVAFNGSSYPRWPEDGESWSINDDQGQVIFDRNSAFITLNYGDR